MSDDQPNLSDGSVELRAHDPAETGAHSFDVERAGEPVGVVAVRVLDEGTGRLSWRLDPRHRGRGNGVRAVRLLTDWALTEAGQGGLGLSRVEALVPSDDDASLRLASRSGLLREGLSRIAPGSGERSATTGYVVSARLATDPPLSDPSTFRTLLNSFLPRKRAIGQMLIRDTAGRVLLCQLTYKRDWDLPGGVVEVGESPRLATSRELTEELGLEIEAGPLVLTDWLPPWGGWDDAVCLVFDGGVHDPGLLDGIVKQEREIVSAEFLTLAEVHERAADFTARRIEAALAALDGRGPAYTESGRGA
ncbi:GNAT family N-acetyltransferase [Nocardioides sp. AE5]|uniref:NUDIX hydrolase n=1 Tax=Nocardioides sp. AE5 TaxID=2962573 RepID=UPI002881B5FE|nr:GNAT family N-acetyltransferase [Nocardioides sp. AE5]MDT0201032.1 GNAT family N-acetyltransferase [Nocardioides sp. AE5]